MSLFAKQLTDEEDDFFTAVQPVSRSSGMPPKPPKTDGDSKFRTKAEKALKNATSEPNRKSATSEPSDVAAPVSDSEVGTPPPDSAIRRPIEEEVPGRLFRKRPRTESEEDAKKKRQQRSARSQADASKLQEYISKLKR